ncbi:hypothetical protein PLICRDRAFT_172110 [Plicaturopsis crispa FD-325 SS-3]|nr:hypothetical protein PLICRDRAFT_172110 [Plicaturopsis crispa FD-325 SS-3]
MLLGCLGAGQVGTAGIELSTELVLADFLVTYTPYMARVVFHPTLTPWLVSDVTPPNPRAIFEELSDPVLFLADDATDGTECAGKPASNEHLQKMVAHWTRYLADTILFRCVLVGIQASSLGAQMHALLSYDQYMHKFPDYFPQGDMESNELESVTKDGSRVNYQIGPILCEAAGTNGQHSFY